jgi:hypothetical protein
LARATATDVSASTCGASAAGTYAIVIDGADTLETSGGITITVGIRVAAAVRTCLADAAAADVAFVGTFPERVGAIGNGPAGAGSIADLTDVAVVIGVRAIVDIDTGPSAVADLAEPTLSAFRRKGIGRAGLVLTVADFLGIARRARTRSAADDPEVGWFRAACAHPICDVTDTDLACRIVRLACAVSVGVAAAIWTGLTAATTADVRTGAGGLIAASANATLDIANSSHAVVWIVRTVAIDIATAIRACLACAAAADVGSVTVTKQVDSIWNIDTGACAIALLADAAVVIGIGSRAGIDTRSGVTDLTQSARSVVLDRRVVTPTIGVTVAVRQVAQRVRRGVADHRRTDTFPG